MNRIYFVLTFAIAYAVFDVHASLKSLDLVEYKCINATECKQFETVGIQANCTGDHCQCSNAKGDLVDCMPMSRKVSNIIGGPCPCNQPNSECDEKQQICYCAKDFMPSSYKRRCIAKNAHLGEKCEQDLQCQRQDYNSQCNPQSKMCDCMEDFLNINGICESIVGSLTSCNNDTKCTSIYGNNTRCFAPDRHCVCTEGFITSSLNNSNCLLVPKYLENCTESVQCVSSMGPGGICSENKCQCNVDFFVEKRTTDTLEYVCSPIVKRGEYCRYDEDCYQRQLNESEQSLSCMYGECNCKFGFVSFNNGDCIRGSAATKMTLGYVAAVLAMTLYMIVN